MSTKSELNRDTMQWGKGEMNNRFCGLCGSPKPKGWRSPQSWSYSWSSASSAAPVVGSSPNIKYHHIATLRLLWSYLGSKNPAWLLRYEIEKGLRTIFSSLMCPCRHRNHHDIGMEQHTKATLQHAMDGESRRNPTCKIDETLYFTKTPKMF